VFIEDRDFSAVVRLPPEEVADAVLVGPARNGDLKRSLGPELGEAPSVLVIRPDGRDEVPAHRTLVRAGLATAVAGSGEAALRFCQLHPEVRVAIVDLEQVDDAGTFTRGLPRDAPCRILAIAPRERLRVWGELVGGRASDVLVRPVCATELLW